MIRAIWISGEEHHLLCPMQCCLNGVHVNEDPKFLADSFSMTIHAIQLTGPFITAHPLSHFS